MNTPGAHANSRVIVRHPFRTLGISVQSRLFGQMFRFGLSGGLLAVLVAGGYWVPATFLHVDPNVAIQRSHFRRRHIRSAAFASNPEARQPVGGARCPYRTRANHECPCGTVSDTRSEVRQRALPCLDARGETRCTPRPRASGLRRDRRAGVSAWPPGTERQRLSRSRETLRNELSRPGNR